MALILGIDTGGTHTDGVIIDPVSKKIISKAKAQTTKHDLMVGIKNCLQNLNISAPDRIKLVSISTTLATNAIVEGRGGRVGLMMIGRGPEGKLPAARVEQLQGRYDIKGREKEGIREEEVKRAVANMKDYIDAIAISGYASVRNPDHELKVKEIVKSQLELPVVCAHELSNTLGFHDRTVTTVLNAGLISIIDDLIKATKRALSEMCINAQIMFVKGDGNLMQESYAMDKPIETILSGPAASILGGIFLSGKNDALVLDMGGTTTDIANVEEGSVKIRKSGAKVGGWLTQVQAAEISTFGLGGDSKLYLNTRKEIEIGPQKVTPLCMAGVKYPNLLDEIKKYKIDDKYEMFYEQEFNCFSFVKRPRNIMLSEQDEKIIKILEDDAHSILYLARIIGRDPEGLEMDRLVRQGLVERISLTPTDVLQVKGLYSEGDREISELAIEILAKKMGIAFPAILNEIITKLTNRLTIACLQSVADFENQGCNLEKSEAAKYLINNFLDSEDSSDFLDVKCIVKKPVVAIGAPVKAWLPLACQKLNTELIIPEHAEVANAIGASVGQVIETTEVLIRPDKESKLFIVHAPWGRRTFEELDDAKYYAVEFIKKHTEEVATSAGSKDCEILVRHEDIYIKGSGSKESYVETKIMATAVGKPMYSETDKD